MYNELKHMWDSGRGLLYRHLPEWTDGEDIRCPVRDTNTEPRDYTSQLSLHEVT